MVIVGDVRACIAAVANLIAHKDMALFLAESIPLWTSLADERANDCAICTLEAGRRWISTERCHHKCRNVGQKCTPTTTKNVHANIDCLAVTKQLDQCKEFSLLVCSQWPRHRNYDCRSARVHNPDKAVACAHPA